jgi:hypothetical protein
VAGNLGEFFEPVLGRDFDADGEFCGFGLAHINCVYYTISADMRQLAGNSMILTFLFDRSQHSTEGTL